MNFWSSDLLKYLGLGLLEIGGIGLIVYFGISNIKENSKSLESSENAIEPSNTESKELSTESTNKQDLEYQFLYKLASKVFVYLKSQNPTAKENKTKAVTQENLISWLASEFKESDPKSDTWQNFKSLCDKQKIKDSQIIPEEDDGEDNVEVPASRVCYVDKGYGYTSNSSDKYEKGFLGLWESDTPGYLGFGNWNWYNLKLWENFRDIYPDQSPLTKFDEWFDKQTKDDQSKKTTTIKIRLGE